MLSASTLHPLTTRTFQFSYCFEHPLQCIATCYVPPSLPSNVKTSFSLLFVGGNSLNQETWLPLIKEIYRLTSDENCPVHIISAWVVEQPNHGDSGVLNAKVLQEHYSKMFKTAEIGGAVRAFLDSNALSAMEKENLVGIGHSGGVAGIIHALEMVKSEAPLSVFIGVDPGWVDSEHNAWECFQRLYVPLIRSNSRRPRRWPSKVEAMRWLKAHRPWKDFHPEVLQIISECYFLPDPDNQGGVVPKTTVEQETASFLNDGTYLVVVPFMQTILHRFPTHLLMAKKRDFWTSELETLIWRNLEKDRLALASVREVDGGHYLPVTKPKELASEIVQVLLKPKGTVLQKL